MFIAVHSETDCIFYSEEEETFEDFVRRLLEDELPYYENVNLANLEFAAIIPTEISIKRKEI